MKLEEIREYAKCAKDPVYFIDTYGYALNIEVEPVRVDKITAFTYQREIIQKYHKFQNNIILKSRQCLPSGTLVDIPFNDPIPIEDLKIGDKVISYDFKNKNFIEDNVRDCWVSGDIQCVKIKYRHVGESIIHEIEVGENHPFYLYENPSWLEAKNLKPDDQIMHALFEWSALSIAVIISVEYTEIKKCYDISILVNENYFINGLLTHNTGLSVITAGYVVWTLCFKSDQKILIVANDRNGAVRFLNSVNSF